MLKPAGDVKLPPPTVQPGGKCESGAAGCEGGEFTGELLRRMKLGDPEPQRRSRRRRRAPTGDAPSRQGGLSAAYGQEFVVDLQRRRDQLVARVAELQWDLGGLAYEMATRNRIKVEVLVKRAVDCRTPTPN